MRKTTLLFPTGIAAIVIGVMLLGYGLLDARLRSEDTTFSGYLSGLMLNFWGGDQTQLIRVNLYNRSIALYEDGNLYRFSHVAGAGNPNNRTATPTGQFRILSKEKRHISSLSGVIMPLSMRFYGGYYFHDIPLTPRGAIINTKYSNGCIRLPSDLAAEMFAWVNIGAYVEIYNARLARVEGTTMVYLLSEDGNSRQPIASEQVFSSRGYRWQDVAVVPSAELDSIPVGEMIWY